MERLIVIDHPGQLQEFPATGIPGNFSSGQAVQDKPDLVLLALDQAEEPVARCSLWWSGTAPYGTERLGYIGHYAASARAGSELLLRSACLHLANQGCTLAVGPINGNTWRNYRFVTEPGEQPPFFLEPLNPPEWPRFWRESGFQPFAKYTSAINTGLDKPARDFSRAANRYEALGIKVRHLQMAHYERELGAIYRMSIQAFANNFLYTPMAENEFLGLYAALKSHVNPEMVLLAEDAHGPQAFLFAVPDILQRQRGETIDTAIIKTVAVAPSPSAQGLGAYLVAQAMPIFHDLGYRRVIHALMHEGNSSQNVSRHQINVRTIRRYTLFAKPLGAAS